MRQDSLRNPTTYSSKVKRFIAILGVFLGVVWADVRERVPQIIHDAPAAVLKAARRAASAEGRQLPSQIEHGAVELRENRRVEKSLAERAEDLIRSKTSAGKGLNIPPHAIPEVKLAPDKLSADIEDMVGQAARSENHLGEENSYFAENLKFLEEKAKNYKKPQPVLPKWWPSARVPQQRLKYPAFAEPVPDYRVLAVIPETREAYMKVFKKTPLPGEWQEVKTYGALFSRLDNTHVAGNVDFDKSALVDFIRENRNTRPLIIVAHSEEERGARSIVLPNGQRVTSQWIHQTCEAVNSQCVIVTCQSPDLNLRSDLSLPHSYQIVRRGVKLLDLLSQRSIALPGSIKCALADGSMTSTELTTEVMKKERRLRKAPIIIIPTTIVGAGAVAGYAGNRVFSSRHKGH